MYPPRSWLTHFPAGYSVYAAAMLGLGAGVGNTVRLLAAAATMLGWWGWARQARAFFCAGMDRTVWRLLAYAIAVTTPLLFTPSWGGTDIFLWALVPWTLEWVVKGSLREGLKGSGFDALA